MDSNFKRIEIYKTALEKMPQSLTFRGIRVSKESNGYSGRFITHEVDVSFKCKLFSYGEVKALFSVNDKPNETRSEEYIVPEIFSDIGLIGEGIRAFWREMWYKIEGEWFQKDK